MRRRRAGLVAGVALLSGVTCQRELTIQLLENADKNDASSGDAGSLPPPPCQKVGPEVCNGGDDDCNGLVDEGCAYTVAWSREPPGASLGHATGGVAFEAPCADGSVLTGMLVGLGKWLNQIVAVCRQVELHMDATQTPPNLAATLGTRHDSSFAPATTLDPANKVQDLLCPDGLVVSGINGTTTTDEPRYILGLRLTCAPLLVVTAASGSTLGTDAPQTATAGPVVCATCSTTQAFNFVAMLDPGRVATSLFGGDGLWVDRVGVGASLGRIAPR